MMVTDIPWPDIAIDDRPLAAVFRWVPDLAISVGYT